ncbi:hypothetical protein VN97_g8952 [Penicillium thymicola]|uniref:Uncharacterized protein n=1 Tax=Penicillium thymicola TaxID=293382 RepID=A0AAI9TCB8_PENTH|nr:hypothetical protein VN97_g8952 [Penicillium thymicola]
MAVLYAAQALIIARRYAPLPALWGSTRGARVFVSISVLTIVGESLVCCVGVLLVLLSFSSSALNEMKELIPNYRHSAVMTSILRMVCMKVALQHSGDSDTVYYVSVAMVWSTI